MIRFFQATLLLLAFSAFAQRPDAPKIKVSGNVIERTSRQPLEYATISFTRPGQPRPVAGGITDSAGAFSIEVPTGTYDITIEFISFKPHVISGRELTADVSLGTVELADDATQLDEVVVRAEQTTVDIKLDKKVYNVGQDLMVKGGTVSEVTC